jgi:hypothetical protein
VTQDEGDGPGDSGLVVHYRRNALSSFPSADSSKPDLLVANYDKLYETITVNVLLGNGDGTFQTASPSKPFFHYGITEMSVADFDADGRLDLALALQAAAQTKTTHRPLNDGSTSVTLPRVVAKVSLTGQTASIPTTTLLTPTRDGLYRVSGYIDLTTGSSGGAVDFYLSWTDGAGLEECSQEGNGACFSVAAYAVPPFLDNSATILVRAKAGTPITYSINYGVVPGVVYDVFVTVEQLM